MDGGLDGGVEVLIVGWSPEWMVECLYDSIVRCMDGGVDGWVEV